MQKNLILFRGLPGSGKTTLADLVCNVVLSADDYHTDDQGNYNWKPENVSKSHEWCQAQTEKALQHGIDIVGVANTNTTDRELKPYYDLGKKYGYMIHSVIVENRMGTQNVHNVPAQTIKKMKERFSIKL